MAGSDELPSGGGAASPARTSSQLSDISGVAAPGRAAAATRPPGPLPWDSAASMPASMGQGMEIAGGGRGPFGLGRRPAQVVLPGDVLET